MGANIILTGLMGCGKSTVGKLLAKNLKTYTFVDVDDTIVDIEGMSISDIFSKKSETYFRELESQIIEELSEEENLVIALGGGAFENEDNRENLKNNGKVFYLKAKADVLYERIKDDNTRPLLMCENPMGKLEELLKIREKNYLKADVIIDVKGKSPERIVEEILRNI